jgi:hypothetical protein
MFERVNVLDQLTTEGVPPGDTAKAARVRQYLQKLKDNPEICWPDLATDFRRNYYDLFDTLVPQVFKSDAPMAIYNLVENLDLTKDNEAKLAADFARTCDAQKHQLTLMKLASSRVPAIKALAKDRLKTLQQPAPAH